MPGVEYLRFEKMLNNPQTLRFFVNAKTALLAAKDGTPINHSLIL